MVNIVNRYFISRLEKLANRKIKARKKILDLETDREYLTHLLKQDKVLKEGETA